MKIKVTVKGTLEGFHFKGDILTACMRLNIFLNKSVYFGQEFAYFTFDKNSESLDFIYAPGKTAEKAGEAIANYCKYVYSIFEKLGKDIANKYIFRSDASIVKGVYKDSGKVHEDTIKGVRVIQMVANLDI